MFERFNGNVVPFADESTSTNRTVFGSETQSDDIDDNLNSDFKKGWEIVGLNDNPTREDFNAMGYTLGYLTSYLYQNGVAEYNLLQEYKNNSIAIGTDGNIYQSLVDNNIGNALTDTTKWVCIASKNSIVNNIDELKTISNIESINVLGYYEKGDGGGGTFYWDATSIEADNGGTIIQATGVTTGRWKRVFSGAVNVKWFGAKGDGVTDDTVAIQNAVDVLNMDCEFDDSTYLITNTITVGLASKKTIDGKNAKILFTGTGVCLDINCVNGTLYSYDKIIKNFTFTNSGGSNTAIALRLNNARRCDINSLKFFGKFAKCIFASEFKEGFISNINIENDPSNKTGVGISLASCLNVSITESFIGYCEYGVKFDTPINSGVGHGNEGITISNNTVVANSTGIDLGGVFISIVNNTIDLCGTNGIITTGNSISILSNWIQCYAITNNVLCDIRGAIDIVVSNNMFINGIGATEITGILADSTKISVCNNVFDGVIRSSIALSSGNSFSSVNNMYHNGAIAISPTGTSVNQLLLDPQAKGYISKGLTIGNDLTLNTEILSVTGIIKSTKSKSNLFYTEVIPFTGTGTSTLVKSMTESDNGIYIVSSTAVYSDANSAYAIVAFSGDLFASGKAITSVGTTNYTLSVNGRNIMANFPSGKVTKITLTKIGE